MTQPRDAIPTSSPFSIFEEGLRNAELCYQRCVDCHQSVFHPRVACPYCGSVHLEWARSRGRGEVYSTTAVRRREGTHNVALIDLREGFRMMATVAGVAPDQVRVGATVQAHLVEGMEPGDLHFEEVPDRA